MIISALVSILLIILVVFIVHKCSKSRKRPIDTNKMKMSQIRKNDWFEKSLQKEVHINQATEEEEDDDVIVQQI